MRKQLPAVRSAALIPDNETRLVGVLTLSSTSLDSFGVGAQTVWSAIPRSSARELLDMLIKERNISPLRELQWTVGGDFWWWDCPLSKSTKTKVQIDGLEEPIEIEYDETLRLIFLTLGADININVPAQTKKSG